MLPEYRQTPDYETALLHKYGHTPQVQTILYSSQPEISSHNLTEPKGALFLLNLIALFLVVRTPQKFFLKMKIYWNKLIIN